MEAPSQQVQEMRQRLRQPDDLGELTEEADSRPKGMSSCLLDLNGSNFFTRNKPDVAQRDEELGFIFRAMDRTNQKWITVRLRILRYK